MNKFGDDVAELDGVSRIDNRDEEYTLWGEGYLIRDGQMTQLCRKGEHILI